MGVPVNPTQSEELAAVTCCGHEIYMVCLCQVMRGWQPAVFRFFCIMRAVDQLSASQQVAHRYQAGPRLIEETHRANSSFQLSSLVIFRRSLVYWVRCSKRAAVSVSCVRQISDKMLHIKFLSSSLEHYF